MVGVLSCVRMTGMHNQNQELDALESEKDALRGANSIRNDFSPVSVSKSLNLTQRTSAAVVYYTINKQISPIGHREKNTSLPNSSGTS
jgi:hypothetical protein